MESFWLKGRSEFFACIGGLPFFSREQQQHLITKTTFTASLILIFFTTFCIATSNPFLRTSIPSINSLAELNPILQDPVLAIHPPCIYAGYVASAIAFSLCMSSFRFSAKGRENGLGQNIGLRNNLRLRGLRGRFRGKKPLRGITVPRA